ncbi:MAG TPA: cupredoxin domain-containing protein [Chloroflexota bacterium]|nr:cupredoxin domain-containing protein [Chloroflexota bacterium]
MRLPRWTCPILALALLASYPLIGCARPASPATPTTASTPSTPVAQRLATTTTAQARDRAGSIGGNEGGEGGDAGEGSDRARTTRVSLTITDSSIQPATLTARAGLIEFDVTNNGQKAHSITISGPQAHDDLGVIAPSKSTRVQGNLVSGTYRIAMDVNTKPTPGPTAMLRIQ